MVFSIPQLLNELMITALLFGTNKLRNIGSDLGAALKGFKKAMRDDDPETAEAKKLQDTAAEESSAQNSSQAQKNGDQT